MKKIILILFLLFVFSSESLAGSAKSVVETKVEGEKIEVYQSVETTVNGETIKKESREPGRLELEIKEGEEKPKINFSQDPSSLVSVTPIPFPKPEFKKTIVFSFTNQVIKFFRKFLTDLTKWLK